MCAVLYLHRTDCTSDGLLFLSEVTSILLQAHIASDMTLFWILLSKYFVECFTEPLLQSHLVVFIKKCAVFVEDDFQSV